MDQFTFRMSIARMIEQSRQPVMVSDDVFKICFKQDDDPLRIMLLVMNGNRPPETTDEVVEIFCRQLNCTHWYNPINGTHVFTRN